MKRIVSAVLSMCMILSSNPFSVSAETSEYKTLLPIVIALSEDGRCFLSDGRVISQNQFHAYSGNEVDLQLGDVVGVYNAVILETDPPILVFDQDSYITYYGNASDYYADSVTELTVTDIVDGSPVWSDTEGIIYDASLSYYNYEMISACSEGFLREDFSIGDTASCVLGYNKYGSELYLKAFILEKTSEAEYETGDATGDGEIDLLDVVAMNKYIMVGTKLAPAGKKAADFNGNGMIEPTESLHLLKYLLHVVDTLQMD